MLLSPYQTTPLLLSMKYYRTLYQEKVPKEWLGDPYGALRNTGELGGMNIELKQYITHPPLFLHFL